MRSLEGERLLLAWEDAAASDPVRRPLWLLSHAMPGTSAEALEDVSLVRRNRLLLQLYASTFGPELQGFSTCMRCSAAMEFRSEVEGLLSVLPDRAEEDEIAVGEKDAVRVLEITTRMVLHALQAEAVADRERILLLSCIAGGSDPRGAFDESSVSESALAALQTAVAARNADAEMSCTLECAECGELNRVDFDPAHFVWLAIRHRVSVLLGDVHEIARAYGWGERSILRMSEVRREAYLKHIVGAGATA
ncbi:hypothetical protein [Terriglobus roseus]|uniref:T4 bacteriophage base plate protein n=1 Tax=Terriglobus roseus TaxID=392734 RepID=A0A1H4IXX8_9BACT|nr:hypothetical protein [Terriglobus roseus]SEB38873.1 hypothetical protein SAMN05443244_0188 [Terriglobus roseus]